MPGPHFPILLKKVVYDGTHSGDYVPCADTSQLLKEVEVVLHSSDVLDNTEKEFFSSIKRPCEASIVTGNPIIF
jgi:hypothetical protein